MITTVTTMMTGMVVAPSLWGVLVGIVLLLLTCMVVAPSLLIGSVLLLLLLTDMVVASSGVEAVQAKHTSWHCISQQTE